MATTKDDPVDIINALIEILGQLLREYQLGKYSRLQLSLIVPCSISC